ncbi:hypothetical protein NQ318_014721 [Aromia moschata]|uniref:Endonuclease/exonuclease/phosphatase domain-containing protein n=1 Tax=Aromia moschata TaxID=1265417 RepID=A0AAV8ZD01_9CUCU|nr:hypothetical protein NQ318_014721 [Aromia moschata]
MKSKFVEIISKAKDLKTQEQLGTFFMSYDKTPRQQEQFRHVKKELEERKSKGEKNIKIAYSNGTPFYCYYQNVNGLKSKTQHFFNAISTLEYDIICITESGLSEDVNSEELFPASYLVHRSDRNFLSTGQCRGGGVLIAVKNKFEIVKLSLDSVVNVVPSIDIVGCKVNFINTILMVLTIYVPPSTSTSEYDTFLNALENISLTQANCNILICGDFNVNKFNSDPNDPKVRLVHNFMGFYNICQYNEVVNSNGRLSDLVFGNFNCSIGRDNVPLVKEDTHHPSLIINFELDIAITTNFSFNNENKVYNFRKDNFLELYNQLFHTDWSSLEQCSDVNEICDAFYLIINNIFEDNVPLFKKSNRTFPPWFNSNIKSNIRCKELAHKNYKKYKSEYYLNDFRTLRTILKQQIDDAYKEYIYIDLYII